MLDNARIYKQRKHLPSLYCVDRPIKARGVLFHTSIQQRQWQRKKKITARVKRNAMLRDGKLPFRVSVVVETKSDFSSVKKKSTHTHTQMPNFNFARKLLLLLRLSSEQISLSRSRL